MDLAQGNDQIIRGHNCVWYNQLPSWVTSGNFNSTALTSVVQTHCSTIVGHWKGQMYVSRYLQCATSDFPLAVSLSQAAERFKIV